MTQRRDIHSEKSSRPEGPTWLGGRCGHAATEVRAADEARAANRVEAGRRSIGRRRWCRGPELGVVALVLVTAAGGCSRERSESVTTTAGDLVLEVTLRTDPPRREDNVVEVAVRDRQGRPVNGAEVEMIASMPAMAWVPGMRSRAGVEPRGEGRYRGEFDVAMGGTWALDLSIASSAGNGKASYSFTLGSRGLVPVGPGGSMAGVAGKGVGGGDIAPGESRSVGSRVGLAPAVIAALGPALDAYEDARARLAADRLDGLDEVTARALAALRATGVAFGLPETDVGHCLDEAMLAAERLGAAADLGTARAAFAELSRFMIAMVGVDPRLSEGQKLFECPMRDGFNLWVQRTETIDNPFLGTAMADCGVEREWRSGPAWEGDHATDVAGGAAGDGGGPTGAGDAAAHVAADGDVAYYSCSMHTNVKSAEAGTCPICSMDLVPVTEREVESGEIVVDPMRRQTIGVRTGKAERRPLLLEVRAVGKVTYDETRLTEVSLKIPGWIGSLHVNATGQAVRRGETLFTLYSPELYAAQGEYLAALESQRRAGSTSAPDRADYMVEASRQRLRLWDISEAELERIVATGTPLEQLSIVSPVSGYVIEKNVVEGAAVEAGRTLFRIAALDRVWVEADVFESELQLVGIGQRATVTLPNLPGKRLEGRVAFIYPYLDDATRTGRVRVELPNPGLLLKPAMYADVTFAIDRGEALQVPESAVLYSGPRRLVFLDLGEGRLKPVPIEVGVASGDWIEVLGGLEEGALVVTSGTFLVAAESRLKSAVEQWE